jgi:trimeric autotransporter adhesin
VTSDYSLIGGGATNVATSPYSVVGGGHLNSATGDYSSVAGGDNNAAGGLDSTVGGGYLDKANGGHSVVSGGYGNKASNEVDTVGGGYGNTASGSSSTVAGGYQNAASGGGSTVAGGSGNAANGDYSFVAGVNSTAGGFGFALGRQAKATDSGSFVWGDSSAFDIGSNGTNTFTARSIGGARFVSGLNASGVPSAGVQLPAGGGAWSSLSDRNAKERFKSVNKGALLRKLARIPIERWSYKAQGPSIVHMGPTAQDFAQAFGLGEDIRHISTVDADGVALAAIQGLYRQNQALERRVRRLEHQLEIREGGER